MSIKNSALGKLVTFRNNNDFEIIGILFQKNVTNDTDISKHENNSIIIHIHGSFGNFYQNKFIWYMSDLYCKNGIDFLSINTSAHDGISEGYYGKNLKYVGGAVTRYQDSQLDIQAAVDFARQLGYDDIILQGHSLGCDKIIDFSINSRDNLDIILLSPADSYAVQSNWIAPETVGGQISRLQNELRKVDDFAWGSADLDWLKPHEYGARGKNEDWVYQIPVTRDTLLSILTGSAFKYLNLKLSPEFYIDVNAVVYIGGSDALLFVSPTEMSNYLRGKFKNFTPILDIDADHDIIGVEEKLILRLIEWIHNRK